MQIPISWGTSTQKDNLLKSLKSWAANDGYSKVEFSELGGARVYGFKEDKVLKIYFFLSNGGGPWKYSLTENGLCKNHEISAKKSAEPAVIYKWSDFEKGILPDPESPLPKPQT